MSCRRWGILAMRGNRKRMLQGEAMDRKQRISYLPLEAMDDEMRAEMERCRREGTPRPESSAVRAHVPACFWAFARSWQAIFRDGVCDHAIKELCRVYVSRSVKCEYCGNQRSEKARAQGAERGEVRRPAQLRDLNHTRRTGEGRASLRRGDHLAAGPGRRAVGAAAPALLRARTGRARLLRRADHGPAELAEAARHRAPRGAARDRRLDGTGIRYAGGARRGQGI